MLYMVESWASMERGNTVDKGEGGPGAVFAKVAERFHPQSMWGDASRRHVFMVVELNSAVDMAELMYIMTWFTGNDPKITPIMPPETFEEAIAKAKKIVSPP